MTDTPVLYLVGTPIGNLSDLSQRAIETLQSVDFIAAEDTRNALKLMNHLQIKKPLISYFEHNRRQRGMEILEKIKQGKIGALITDAGMPAISDPGEDLVALLYENGYTVSMIPGPCALIGGLVLSGLATGRFCFEGFLSTTKKNRMAHLASLTGEMRTMIFYEAPQKLIATLTDLSNAFGGDRRCALVREITKLHEQVHRGTLDEMLTLHQQQPPRGEYVIVVEGAAQPPTQDAFWNDWSVEQHVAHYIAIGRTKMDAMKQVAKERGVSKSEIYQKFHNS